ncbi:hypothetical protein A4A49_10577 [Nicotiana attenuata]|uniref:Uncharacterized protein n=1 Tax=Nicotiana attenuata TaxID=49451 RepID=A0A314LBZ3_NICAT|nr:hypothetical protein A4A49_10577 [Nicotiana attenuata]
MNQILPIYEFLDVLNPNSITFFFYQYFSSSPSLSVTFIFSVTKFFSAKVPESSLFQISLRLWIASSLALLRCLHPFKGFSFGYVSHIL